MKVTYCDVCGVDVKKREVPFYETYKNESFEVRVGGGVLAYYSDVCRYCSGEYEKNQLTTLIENAIAEWVKERKRK